MRHNRPFDLHQATVLFPRNSRTFAAPDISRFG
jgi:hypothetical protein